MTTLAPPNLGDILLVVIDNSPISLDMLRTVIAQLANPTNKYFTLLHCCPPRYWEHGGGADPETRRNLDEAWEAEEDEFKQTRHYLDQACRLLEAAGVPAAHINTLVAVEATSLCAAAEGELKRGHYSGVIVSSYHADVVKRLSGRGLTDIFRRMPKVAVWTIATEAPV